MNVSGAKGSPAKWFVLVIKGICKIRKTLIYNCCIITCSSFAHDNPCVTGEKEDVL